jgi:hypothetical protein
MRIEENKALIEKKEEEANDAESDVQLHDIDAVSNCLDS